MAYDNPDTHYESAEKPEIGFEKGERVVVSRADGDMQIWKVEAVRNQDVEVTALSGDKRLTKHYKPEILEELNNPIKSDYDWGRLMTKSPDPAYTSEEIREEISIYKQQMGLSDSYELNVEEFSLGVIRGEEISETTKRMLTILRIRFAKLQQLS